MRNPSLTITSLFALLAPAAVLISAEQPKAGADLPKPVISVGEMRIQTIPAMSFLSMPAETTFAKMGEPVKVGFDRVFGAAYQAKLFIVRPTMMVYQGSPHMNYRPDAPFKMEFGVIVADDAKVDTADDIKIRKTEPLKCATILYTGPVNDQGKAYEKLIPAITAAGLKPTGEEREMCLYWEGIDSPSNVFMMMVGIK